MKKSLVLAMAMALGVTASAYAANPFSDVPAGHWAYDSINKLAAAGVIEGYGDATFGGDKLMTRYEMAQIVANEWFGRKGCSHPGTRLKNSTRRGWPAHTPQSPPSDRPTTHFAPVRNSSAPFVGWKDTACRTASKPPFKVSTIRT